MKSTPTPTILFAIFLTNLVDVTVTDSGQHHYRHSFRSFLRRLEKSIYFSSPNILPFMVKDNVIENLKKTSNEFKDYCVRYDTGSDSESEKCSPVSSLNKTICYIFYNYIQSTSCENRGKLEEIQSMDPVGFNAYLVQKNENELSPTFKLCIEEFQVTMYKKVAIPGSRFFLSDFFQFVQRLKECIEESYLDRLPFVLKSRVIEYLWQTSNEFKQCCILYDVAAWKKTGYFSPISSLNKTLNGIFFEYEERAKRNIRMVKEIESVDPIGFNVYLTRKNVDIRSPIFITSLKKFRKTMYRRVRLVNSRTDNSQIEFFAANRNGKVHKIPDHVRDLVTTEYAPFDVITIDFFTKLAMKQLPNMKMYSIRDFDHVHNFKPHNSSETNDVQITYGFMRPTANQKHAICIFYHASTRKVLVYDSSMHEKLDTKQEEIIDRLYPYNVGIVYKRSKTLQGRTPSCGIFAVIYATMLLLGDDPAETKFRLNNIHGDESLYMRLHILNMFANRELALMK